MINGEDNNTTYDIRQHEDIKNYSIHLPQEFKVIFVVNKAMSDHMTAFL